MKTIQFSVTDEEKEEMNLYAKRKGLNNASNLARFSIYQYMRKYPLKMKDTINDTNDKKGSEVVQP